MLRTAESTSIIPQVARNSGTCEDGLIRSRVASSVEGTFPPSPNFLSDTGGLSFSILITVVCYPTPSPAFNLPVRGSILYCVFIVHYIQYLSCKTCWLDRDCDSCSLLEYYYAELANDVNVLFGTVLHVGQSIGTEEMDFDLKSNT